MEDLIRASLILAGGLVAFWFVAVGIKILLADRNLYKRNRDHLGSFWENLLGRNPPSLDHTSIVNAGIVFNVRKNKLMSNGKLTSDAADDILA